RQDGRPDGERAGDDAQPRGRRGRRRTRSAAREGCGTGPVGLAGLRPQRHEGAGEAMSTVTMRDGTGADAGTVELPETVFGIEPNVAVMHQVVTAQLAAARAGPPST